MEQQFEENEEIKRLEPFVECKMVVDKSIIGVKTKLVRIRDPCNGQLLAQIRDPKIAIQPYQTMDGVIDIKDHIDNRKLPHFYKGEVPMTFDSKKLTWATLLELIRSKSRQRIFWDFVESLRQIRLTFNNILMSKFRFLPKIYKKNATIQSLFNQSAVKVEQLYQSNQTASDPRQQKKNDQEEQVG